MSPAETPAVAVRVERARRGLKVGELAELTGVSKQTVWRVESGRYVAPRTLRLVLLALGLPIEDVGKVTSSQRRRAVARSEGQSTAARAAHPNGGVSE